MKYKLSNKMKSLQQDNEFIKRDSNINSYYRDKRNPGFFTEVQNQINYITITFLNSIIYSTNKDFDTFIKMKLNKSRQNSVYHYIKFLSEITGNRELLHKFIISGLNNNSNKLKHTILKPDYSKKQQIKEYYDFFKSEISILSDYQLIDNRVNPNQRKKVNKMKKKTNKKTRSLIINDANVNTVLNIKKIELIPVLGMFGKTRKHRLFINYELNEKVKNNIRKEQVILSIMINGKEYIKNVSGTTTIIDIEKDITGYVHLTLKATRVYKKKFKQYRIPSLNTCNLRLRVM